MSADTVIFVDSDFNPQNDLQAAARAHRIGQTRPVKVIRLVARSTVEEIVLKRADDKLKLTNMVIEGGKFSGRVAASNGIAETAMQLADMLKFGLDKLFDSEESTITEKDLERILGGSYNNAWIVEEESKKLDNEDITMETNEDLNVSNMYVFEGEDYSKYPNDRDKEAFDKMVADLRSDIYSEDRLLRSERKMSVTQLVQDLPVRKRKVLTPQELEERRKKRQENAAKRAKLKEEEELRKERELERKLEKLWKENSYNSLNIALEEDREDETDDNESFTDNEENEPTDIQYVRGDVTHPINTCGTDAIIVHCVDDSGRWGQGGLFSALSRRSSQPETLYELANQMKDLNLGDTHLVPVDDRESRKVGRDYVALVVAQTRDRHGRLSGILLTSLSQGLQRIAQAAKTMKATVHLPRVGYSTPGFNWYGTERLIRKHLASKGIKTSIYYFPRNQSKQSKSVSPSPSSESRASKDGKSKDKKATFKSGEAASDRGATAVTKTLPDFMSGVTALFYNVTEGEKKRFTRFLVAYNGDVSKSASQDVTHVVCGTCGEDEVLTRENLSSDVKFVNSKWLDDCFRKRRILDSKNYEGQSRSSVE